MSSTSSRCSVRKLMVQLSMWAFTRARYGLGPGSGSSCVAASRGKSGRLDLFFGLVIPSRTQILFLSVLSSLVKALCLSRLQEGSRYCGHHFATRWCPGGEERPSVPVALTPTWWNRLFFICTPIACTVLYGLSLLHFEVGAKWWGSFLFLWSMIQ